MAKDYYKLLEIPRNATEQEIRKSYRKLALKYHPDRNPNDDQAEEKFKDVAEAYETLTNPEKRKLFDMYGEEGVKFGGPGGGDGGHPGGGPHGQHFTSQEANRIFQQLFSAFGDVNGNDHGGSSPFGTRLVFGDAGFGSGGPFGSHLNGFGSTAGAAGGGNQRSKRRGFGADATPPEELTYMFQVPLADIYTGASRKLKIKRTLRDGRKTEKVLAINIKPGCPSGTKINYPGEGDELPNGRTQTLVVVVSEKPDPVFKRSNSDLTMTLDLDISEALCGYSRTIELPDSRHLRISDEKPVQPGQPIVISGAGLPDPSSPNKRGNLIININVKYPAKIPAERRDQLRALLKEQ